MADNQLDISSPEDIQEYYLRQGVAPGVDVDTEAGNTTEPGRAVDWMARHWWNWRKQKEAENENRLLVDPHGAAADAAMGFMPMGMVGTLGGRLAAKANLGALRKATKMAAAGHSADDIWKATGWFKDVDKNWKFEIPDPQELFNFGGFSESNLQMPKLHREGNNADLMASINHPELFENYPEFGNLLFGVRSAADIPGLSGDWTHGWGMRAGLDELLGPASESDKLLAHELQHGIQGIEGFPTGSSPQRILNSLADVGLNVSHPTLPKEALGMAAYRQVAGEVEARNVERRLGLTPGERQARVPTATAEQFANPIFLHQGNIYQPIEHDPFVGLEAERARLGRAESPENARAMLQPVEHDPFGGAASAQDLGPVLKNPTQGMLEALQNRTKQAVARGEIPEWNSFMDKTQGEYRGALDGDDVWLTPAWKNTHDDIVEHLGKKLSDTDTFMLYLEDGKYKLYVHPKGTYKTLGEGPLYDKVAAQPAVAKLLAKKTAEPQGPSSAAMTPRQRKAQMFVPQGPRQGEIIHQPSADAEQAMENFDRLSPEVQAYIREHGAADKMERYLLDKFPGQDTTKLMDLARRKKVVDFNSPEYTKLEGEYIMELTRLGEEQRSMVPAATSAESPATNYDPKFDKLSEPAKQLLREHGDDAIDMIEQLEKTGQNDLAHELLNYFTVDWQ